MATIEKRGDSYRITFHDGYDMHGNQQRIRMTWTPDPGMTKRQEEKELQRQAVLFEERCKNGECAGGDVRFSQFYSIWWEKHVKTLSAETQLDYHSMEQEVLDYFGNMKLAKIRPQNLMNFYGQISAPGARRDIKYHAVIDLKQVLALRKMSIAQAARVCGVTQESIRHLRDGGNAMLKSTERICRALGLSIKKDFAAVDPDAARSSNTVRHYHSLLSSIFSKAVQWQVIPANPCERVDSPKRHVAVSRYFDENEALLLLDAVDSEPMIYKTIIKLLLYTGFRRSEVCGLEWPDVDFDNHVIHIRRGTVYLPHHGMIDTEAKTASSIRSIKVPSVAFDMLRDYKRWQAEERLKLGDKWLGSDRIFTNQLGGPFNPTTLTSWFSGFISRHPELPDACVHSLRHTNATLQISGGVSIVTVAGRLGHADVSTTERIYAHSIQSAEAAAADVLEDLLTPKGKPQAVSGT